jgi:hypothetical protein
VINIRNINDRLSKLEAVAGIVPNKNPFKPPRKSYPLATQDWTTDELFRLFMGEESLKEKEAKTDWDEWNSDEGQNPARRAFLVELTDEQLRQLIKSIKESGQ